MQQIPHDLQDAARIDGVSEYRIFFERDPAAGAPGHGHRRRLHHDPDLERSLVPADPGAGQGKQTITLGVQQFIGQYVTDWNAVLAALSLAIVPILVLYVIFSRQLVRGLTAGAVK